MPTLDDVTAAAETYGAAQYAQGQTDQQGADAPAIAALNTTISGLQAGVAVDLQTITQLNEQVAKLQAELDAENPPPVDPPPAATGLGFGTYMGQFQAAAVKSAIGALPDFSTYYYQVSGATPTALNISKHKAELDQGISQVIDLDWKASTMTIADVAAGKADAVLGTWLAGLKTLADYAKTKGCEVWFSFVHEAVVHMNASPTKFTGTKVNPTSAQMAAAWNHVMDLCKAQAPNARRIYWFGGMERKVNGEVQGVVFGDSLNPDHIQGVTWDPYLFPSHPAGETAATTFGGVLASLQKRSWFKGRPWGLTEYGASTDHGDASQAAWIASVVSFLKANGASIAVYFDRDTDNDYRITEGATPKSLAAYKTALGAG